MTELILFTPENTRRKNGQLKRDGDEFAREATAYANEFGGQLLSLVGSAPSRRDTFATHCSNGGGRTYNNVIYFGHGTPTSLVHFYSLKNIMKFALHLQCVTSTDTKLILMACSTGKCFAAELCELTGCAVYGHSTAGHTTRNPNITIDLPGGVRGGGQHIVPFKVGDKLWRKWRKWLTEGVNRFRWPHMEPSKIYAELEGKRTVLPERVKNQW